MLLGRLKKYMKKILFIEDEDTLQKALGGFLKDAGYEVINALDGEIGLELASSENPDLILLDIVLPKINGFEVLKELKQKEETKDIPVIVLTNMENIEDIDKIIQLGATTYMIKTEYKLEEVIEKVKGVIGN